MSDQYEETKRNRENVVKKEKEKEEEKIKLWCNMPINQRNYKMLTGSIITLEGLIGVGKTTLGSSLEHYLKKSGLKVKFYPEFKDLNLLKLYIGDMKKYAFSFQVIMLKSRLEVYKKAFSFSKKGGISIIDRSLVGDYTFALMQKNKNYFNEDEWNVYLSMISYDSDIEPHYTLFLNCSPEEAFEKMKKRSIKSEVSGYTIQYFKDLDKTYQETIKSIIHPIIFIPWENQWMNLEDGHFPAEKCSEILNTICGKLME